MFLSEVAMLLNIIHPYTYKLKDDTIQIGPCPEFEERDRAVTQFVQTMLDAEVKVLLHLRHDGNKMHQVLEEVALHADPLYQVFFDERIERVVTTGYGIPIPDERIERASEEQWKYIQSIYTSRAQLQAKMNGHSPILFIGGMLENCITNMAGYFDSCYRADGQEGFYIPELCVSQDGRLWEEMRQILEGKNIHSISREMVLDRLKLTKGL